MYTDLSTMLKSNVEVWTTIPKCKKPADFNSGILWAKQIGEAARIGYSVVFKEPKSNELLGDTPVIN